MMRHLEPALRVQGLLPLAERIAGTLPLVRVAAGTDAACAAARAALIQAIHLSDPLRWTARELASLWGMNEATVRRILGRAGVLDVHVLATADDAVTLCGADLVGRATAVRGAQRADVTCKECRRRHAIDHAAEILERVLPLLGEDCLRTLCRFAVVVAGDDSLEHTTASVLALAARLDPNQRGDLAAFAEALADWRSRHVG